MSQSYIPKNKKILITGGAGYVGSVLAHQLIQNGYKVKVIDNLRWGGNALLGLFPHPQFEFQYGDIRKEADLEQAVQNIDGIVHLAAIVGDPACRAEPELAKQTNLDASIRLLELAKKHKVERFVFASTCSNYGKMKDSNQFCDEDSSLSPVSLYAELKVKFEQYLMQSDDQLSVTALRFSTAYGLSPRMRFDLTVNEFTREVVTGKELIIYGEQFWRPYAHTIDIANASRFILESSPEKVHRQAFNVGDDAENYQKQMIVQEIQKQIPSLKFKCIHKNEDPRDYRVTFKKINSLGFKTSKKVPDGINEIIQTLQSGIFRDPYDKTYSNI